ncbi:hypothetical protein [Sphingomonas sp. SUN039]|uniref:hypothetical protein n=1 Tax=Sphingomonas sp. SUN039 TaxID=2937787 RepID=UPI002164EED5|nr:hypothetical protein [Sphingomonas sp. SUN039]UVO53061.1 hypothetical protein M0209_02600 [Sphingomonas sp. SUN039]
MPKAKQRLHRRIGRWKPITKGMERKNPDSIRKFFFDVIAHDYGKDTVPFADAIQWAISRITPNEQRLYHYPRTAEWLYLATRNEKHIHYGDIEIAARSMGLPTALILTYTRIFSEFQSDEKTKAMKSLRLLEAFKASIEALIAIVSAHAASPTVGDTRLSFEDFDAMRKAYRTAFDLPLFDQPE